MDYLSSYASLLEQSRLYYPSAIRTSLQDHARNPTATSTESATAAASFTPFLGLGLLNGNTVRGEREIPLDLSTKTVRQTPDSTAIDENAAAAVKDRKRSNVRAINGATKKGHCSHSGGGGSGGNGGGTTGTTTVVPPQSTRDPSFMPLALRPIFPHDPNSLPSIINGTSSSTGGVHGAALLSSLSLDSAYMTPFHHSGVCGGVGGFCLDPQRCRMAAATTAAAAAAAASLAAAGSTTLQRPNPFMTAVPYSSLASMYERHLTKLIPGNDSLSSSSSNGIQGVSSSSHLPPKTSKSPPDASSSSSSSSISKQHSTMPTSSPQHSQPVGTADRYHVHPAFPLSLPLYHHHHLHQSQSKDLQSCSCCLAKPFPLSCVCCLPTPSQGYEETPQLLTCYHSNLPTSISVATTNSAPVCEKLVEETQISKGNVGHHHHHQRSTLRNTLTTSVSVTATVSEKTVNEAQVISKASSGHNNHSQHHHHRNHHHHHHKHSSLKNFDKPDLTKKESETPISKKQASPSNCLSPNPLSNKTVSEVGRWIPPHQSKDDVKNVRLSPSSPLLSSNAAFDSSKASKVFAPVANIPPSPPQPTAAAQPLRNNKVITSLTTDDARLRPSVIEGHLSPSHPYYHFYYPQTTATSKKNKSESFSKLVPHHSTKRSKSSPKPSLSSPMPTFGGGGGGGHWTTISKNIKVENMGVSKCDTKVEDILQTWSEKKRLMSSPIFLKKEPTSGELSTSPVNGITRSLTEHKETTNVVMASEPLTLCRTTFEAKHNKDVMINSGQTDGGGGQWTVMNPNSFIVSKEEKSSVNVPNERHPKAVKRKHGDSSGSNSGFAFSSCLNGIATDDYANCNRIKKQPSLRDYKRISEPRTVSKDIRTSSSEMPTIGVTLVRSSDSSSNQYKSKVLHRTVDGTNKGLMPLSSSSSARSSSMLCRIYGEQIQQWLQGTDCIVPITNSNFSDHSKQRLSAQSKCDIDANRLCDPLEGVGGNDTSSLYNDDGDGDDEREDEDEDGRRLQHGSDAVKSRNTVRSKKKRMQKCSEETREDSKKVSIAAVVTPPSQRVENNTKRLIINKALGETALHRAARLGYNEVVAYCLEAETVPVDVRDNAGYTPLHECCSRGHLDIARKLLQHGADVNSNATGGVRPIHDAVENDHVEVVRLLLSYGADPLLATYAGSTPLLLARSWVMTQFLKGFLSDVSGEMDEEVLPWQFHGSATCLDPWLSGYDPLGDLPSDEDERPLTKNIVDTDFADESESGVLLFEVSDKPHITTYRVPALRGKGSGFCLLNDVLRHTGMARNDFLACYPEIQVEVMSRQQFVARAESVQLLVDVNATLSAMPSSITFVELVQWNDFLREILDIERVIIPS